MSRWFTHYSWSNASPSLRSAYPSSLRPGPAVQKRIRPFNPLNGTVGSVGRSDDVNEQICDIFHSDKPPAAGKVPRTRGAQGTDHYVIGKRRRFFPGRPLRRARVDPVGNRNGTPKATSQLLFARRGGPRSRILADRLTRAQSWTVGRAWLDCCATLGVTRSQERHCEGYSRQISNLRRRTARDRRFEPMS